MDAAAVDDATIFMMVGGSHAYGTSTESSDVDYRGVCIPRDPAYYVGFLKGFEQKDSGWGDDDKVVYDLRKAMRLMADANPNMLDMLFVEEEQIVRCEPAWERIRDHRRAFLSRKVRYTYAGYAYSQLKRIERHRKWLRNPPEHRPTREEYGLPERRLVSSDQLGAFQWMLARFLQESVTWFKLSESTREELTGVNYIGAVQSGVPDDTTGVVKEAVAASDNFVDAVMREKKYETARARWKSYRQWKEHRNEARFELEKKHGYDTKHAMHLVRLMRMGHEILTTGEVRVRRPDREELLAIREGAWTYDELVEYADEMEKKIAAAAETSDLPEKPDRSFLDELCQEVIAATVFG